MIKRIFASLAIIILLFSVSGCGTKKDSDKPIKEISTENISDKDPTEKVEKSEEEKTKSTDVVEKQVSETEINQKSLPADAKTNESKQNVSKPKESQKPVVQEETKPADIEQPKQEQKQVEPEQPKTTQESTSQKSDMEYAIELQLSYGDPVTYYNGHPISIDECHSIGGDLKNRRDTTLVNRYECVYTSYGNATAVGLIVQFTIDGQVYRKSYDEYKSIIN